MVRVRLRPVRYPWQRFSATLLRPFQARTNYSPSAQRHTQTAAQ